MSEGSVNMILWLLLLIFVSFWVATFCFIPFTIVSLLVPCIPNLKGLSDLLLKGVTFPYICSDNLVNKRELIRWATTMAALFMSFLWLLILIFISFFVSGLCYFIYTLFQCFIPCCECLQPFGDFLVKGISFPKYCSQKMLLGGK